MARPRPFDDVTAVRATTDGFEAEVDPEWCVGEKPNGGYLLAMLARAATLSAGHTDVVTASAHYLHSPDPGPVEIETTVLRKGRSADHVRATMRQDGRPCVEAVFMVGQLDVGCQKSPEVALAKLPDLRGVLPSSTWRAASPDRRPRARCPRAGDEPDRGARPGDGPGRPAPRSRHPRVRNGPAERLRRAVLLRPVRGTRWVRSTPPRAPMRRGWCEPAR